MDKSSLKWNSLCGVSCHNPYIIQINFGAKDNQFLKMKQLTGDKRRSPSPMITFLSRYLPEIQEVVFNGTNLLVLLSGRVQVCFSLKFFFYPLSAS